MPETTELLQCRRPLKRGKPPPRKNALYASSRRLSVSRWTATGRRHVRQCLPALGQALAPVVDRAPGFPVAVDAFLQGGVAEDALRFERAPIVRRLRKQVVGDLPKCRGILRHARAAPVAGWWGAVAAASHTRVEPHGAGRSRSIGIGTVRYNPQSLPSRRETCRTSEVAALHSVLRYAAFTPMAAVFQRLRRRRRPPSPAGRTGPTAPPSMKLPSTTLISGIANGAWVPICARWS